MRNYLCANYNDIREAISRKFRHYVAHCIVKLLSGNGEFSFYLLLARSLVGCICVSLGSSRGSVSLRLKITRCCPWNTRVSWNSTIFDSSTHLASIKPISEDRKKNGTLEIEIDWNWNRWTKRELRFYSQTAWQTITPERGTQWNFLVSQRNNCWSGILVFRTSHGVYR